MPGDAKDPRNPATFSDVVVVVPAHNEATVIAGVVSSLKESFPFVMVIDDGSTDKTAAEADKAGAFLVKHSLNIGQGGALSTGFRVVAQLPQFRWIVTFDADGQHRVQDAADMVDRARAADLDLVMGTRFGAGSTNAGLAKRAMLKAATAYTRLSTGLALTDTHNGLRVLTRDLAACIQISDLGMGHANDILDYVAHHEVRWEEFPVHIDYTPYSKSKGQSMSNAVNIVFDRWVR